VLPGKTDGVRGALDMKVRCGVRRSAIAEREEEGGGVIASS